MNHEALTFLMASFVWQTLTANMNKESKILLLMYFEKGERVSERAWVRKQVYMHTHSEWGEVSTVLVTTDNIVQACSVRMDISLEISAQRKSNKLPVKCKTKISGTWQSFLNVFAFRSRLIVRFCCFSTDVCSYSKYCAVFNSIFDSLKRGFIWNDPWKIIFEKNVRRSLSISILIT